VVVTFETESTEGSRSARAVAGQILVIATAGETERGMSAALTHRGYALVSADSAASAVRALAAEKATRLVIVTLPLPGASPGELVTRLREIDTSVPIVIVGRDHDVTDASDAMALGATEYVLDPVSDKNDFLGIVGGAIGARRGDKHLQYLRAKDLPAGGWQTVIGQSTALRDVVTMLQQVCARTQRGSTPTIFLGGETGTGKGFIAKCVHANGVRKNRPFVEVNCAALPAALMEAELFGHERGSFTDAKTARSGLFETADGGTLFLDEIAAVPLDLQAKLLSALEEKRIRRLGARQSVSVDVQIIAATHEDLRRMVREGSFREDLFHRLNVVSVVIPPLRLRGEDTVLLGESFLRSFCREYGMPERRLAQDAKEWMLGYAWPGNVRELRNQIERLVLLVDDEIVHAHHFQPAADAPRSVRVKDTNGTLRVSLPPSGVPLADLEREILRQALARCGGNVSRAARFLSISRQTLIYRMKKHGLGEDGK
jgi:two-component system, NtrC family, response regulator AtoC